MVDVVPAVATTAMGSRPWTRSSAISASSATGSMRNAASTGTLRKFASPRPRAMTALSTDECDCSLA